MGGGEKAGDLGLRAPKVCKGLVVVDLQGVHLAADIKRESHMQQRIELSGVGQRAVRNRGP